MSTHFDRYIQNHIAICVVENVYPSKNDFIKSFYVLMNF